MKGLKSSFPLSQKYIDFINTTNVYAEFLEGTTSSGKTTVGAGVKFMRMVSMSKKKLHVIAAKTIGVAEKNIIQQDNGILDLHRNAAYFGNGDKDNKIPHIKFENKIIYVLGYDNRDKWKQVLGAQFGCVYIDEINTADINFIREVSTRNDYMLATLNPDDPSLPVYKEFVNRSRPFKKYIGDVPKEILEELNEPATNKWRYWFFSFRDNLSLSEEDIEKKKQSAPIGTKLYKNKILGLRGRATGLVFPNFERKKHLVTQEYLENQMRIAKIRFVKFSIGVDTAYSSSSEDTIAITYQGITDDGKLVIIDEAVYNNKDRSTPLAPSDIAVKIIEFADKNSRKWGIAKDIFVDSADQATITELNKLKRNKGYLYNINNSYKKLAIVDRINLQLGWIQQGCYLVCDNCKEHIREMEIYSWQEDKEIPEDRNDHTINANQYAWIPYKHLIGVKE